MAYQSIWYYTGLPEDIVESIERDVSENFDNQMGDSKLHGDALNKEKGTLKMPGFQLTIGSVVSCGIILCEQIAKIFCMICGALMENQCNIPDMKKVSSMDGIMILD